MSKTNWNQIEVKQAWDQIAEIAEEQLIYFNKTKQEKIKKSIALLDGFVHKKQHVHCSKRN